VMRHSTMPGIVLIVASMFACSSGTATQISVATRTLSSITPFPTPTQTLSLPTALPTAFAGPTVGAPRPRCPVALQGELQLELDPCMPPSWVNGGMFGGNCGLRIALTDNQGKGVSFELPFSIVDPLKPGKYQIGDAEDFTCALPIAWLYYPDNDTRPGGLYDSYHGGTLVFTQTGLYISGSYHFGARDERTWKVVVDGTFENIPFTPVNMP
jgi:hypothetical protein